LPSSTRRPLWQVAGESERRRGAEDGKPRDIEVFSHGADELVALDVALLLDTNGSMDTELQSAQRAALAVLLRIPRLRRRTVVSFDTDIRFWRADADPVALLPEILAARPVNGASAIRSALVAALDALIRDGSGRGALILLTDGVDYGSAAASSFPRDTSSPRSTAWWRSCRCNTSSASRPPPARAGARTVWRCEWRTRS
jgi:Mg-chelatase subunit ChlD